MVVALSPIVVLAGDVNWFVPMLYSRVGRVVVSLIRRVGRGARTRPGNHVVKHKLLYPRAAILG